MIPSPMIHELNERSREIFREIVETFFRTGEPVGSRTLSRRLQLPLSPATVRNVMADLEEMGLLYAPHTSAGRLPTDVGMRLFVDGLLQIGELTSDERSNIEGQCAADGRSLAEVLGQATEMLSGLSSAVGLVYAPKSEAPIKHIEFVHLATGQALAVVITEAGLVENRLIEVPRGLMPSALQEATNYLNTRLAGRTLGEARQVIAREIDIRTARLDEAASEVVETGLATWTGSGSDRKLIVRGRAKLFDDVHAVEELEKMRAMFESLEREQNMVRLIDSTQQGEGVHVFIGADNRLFDLAGCSMIVAPLASARMGDDDSGRCVGAIGVIGPTRINYARIIPMVDFTARTISNLM